MLQVGGVHEAVMTAAPGWGVPIVQLVAPEQPVATLPAVSAAGAEDVHVRDGVGTIQPWTSTAVALMVSDVPLFAIKPVWPMFEPTSSAMHCTGQVSALKGWLDTPAADAITWVSPGVFDTTVAWFVTTLLDVVTIDRKSVV